ncbi:MAG: hypothetical protein IJ781_05710 [Atopobiaceae bacterium]|nr:hypothetical protein [Atopobiaceae bacterium]
MIRLEDARIPRLTVASSQAEERRLERLVKKGELVAPMRGMFVNADEWSRLSPLEQARRTIATLSDKHPKWVFNLFSAAAIYSLEVGRDDLATVHRLGPRRSRHLGQGPIVVHRGRTSNPVAVDGILVTPVLQTVVDCLCALEFGRALAIADSAQRVLGVTKPELEAELKTRENCVGWKVARDAIAFSDPLSANGGESMARAVMIEQGFMIPRLQVERRDPFNPNKTFYVDYYWNLGEAGEVIGELDGRDKYVLPDLTGGRDAVDVLRAERLRESRASGGRARVMRFSFADVMDERRLVQLMELYGIPRGPARPIGK